MNVYAEYFSENGIDYRKTTIIQIGDSWELLGSAILKNPGSAIPLDDEIDNETFEKISGICHNSNHKHWKKFIGDRTMNCLVKIFNGSFVGDTKEISGVILLFNLHYIREADINRARILFDSSNSGNTFPNIEEIKNLIKDKPVYIGWKDEVKKLKTEKIKDFAKNIFDYLILEDSCYLERNYNSNKFYHPLGIGFVNKDLLKTSPVFESLKRFQKQLEL